MNRLGFYFGYAYRNIRRGGRWTTLAIFCIAAGVAAVVALRSLGLSIGETLQSDVRQNNKGDVRLIKDTGDNPDSQALLFGGSDLAFFSPEEIAAVEDYVEAELGGGTISAYTTGGNISIGGASGGSGNFLLAQFITTYLIEPTTYPPTHELEIVDPAGMLFADAFAGDGNNIVVSENLAEQQGFSVGDEVQISRTDELYTVTAIVETTAEASIRNPLNSFFGFAYLDLTNVQAVIDPDIGVNNLAIALNVPLTEENHEVVAETLEELAEQPGNGRTRWDTAIEVANRNQTVSLLLGDFIVVMGLGALLIGGVGIMNTMLVLVRRRTTEIAAVKTFGMKGRQVGMLFLAEGLLLGVIGSVTGSVIGLALSVGVNQFGEQFLAQPLVWRIHPEALVYGFVLGMVVTVIFGLAPILTALRIRPGIILRPQENHSTRLGLLQTLALMLLIVVLLGLVVGQIVTPSFGVVNSFEEDLFNPWDPYLYGVIGVAATLAILGILTGLLWILIWLIGKLPTFGNVDLRLALRNLSTQRLRTATTLLALSAGMFALSSITFVGEGTRQLLNLQLSGTFGGNVLAFPIFPTGLTPGVSTVIENGYIAALEDVEGINSRTSLSAYNGNLVAVNGDRELIPTNPSNEVDGPFDDEGFAPILWDNFTIWNSTDPNIYDQVITVTVGRNLTAADNDQNVMVGPATAASTLGIEVGSILTYNMSGEEIDFEVVGLTDDANGIFSGNAVLPPGSSGRLAPDFQLYSFSVEEESVGNAIAELNALRVPPTLALDITFIDSLIGRLIDQFAAIPTVVGALSLFAAAVIMANTVALSTLERRRQIGILKAIGLKSGRVLRIMLIESTLIGLLSALLGIGLSSLFVSLFTSVTGTAIPLPTDSRGPALLLVVAAVAIGWLATFLSANVAVRERVMNVLRYE